MPMTKMSSVLTLKGLEIHGNTIIGTMHTNFFLVFFLLYCHCSDTAVKNFMVFFLGN